MARVAYRCLLSATYMDARWRRRGGYNASKFAWTKSAVDGLPVIPKDTVYWDAGLPGFGVKVTPQGRKVFLVLYRLAGGGSRLRKYTIGPYGKITLPMARAQAQRIFAARLDGQDPAEEKKQSRRRMVVDRIDDLIERFIQEHVFQTGTKNRISNLLRRDVVSPLGWQELFTRSKRETLAAYVSS